MLPETFCTWGELKQVSTHAESFGELMGKLIFICVHQGRKRKFRVSAKGKVMLVWVYVYMLIEQMREESIGRKRERALYLL